MSGHLSREDFVDMVVEGCFPNSNVKVRGLYSYCTHDDEKLEES